MGHFIFVIFVVIYTCTFLLKHCQDITEISLKVALNTRSQFKQSFENNPKFISGETGR